MPSSEATVPGQSPATKESKEAETIGRCLPNACCARCRFAVLEIDSEGQAHELRAFRNASDECAYGQWLRISRNGSETARPLGPYCRLPQSGHRGPERTRRRMWRIQRLPCCLHDACSSGDDSCISSRHVVFRALISRLLLSREARSPGRFAWVHRA